MLKIVAKYNWYETQGLVIQKYYKFVAVANKTTPVSSSLNLKFVSYDAARDQTVILDSVYVQSERYILTDIGYKEDVRTMEGISEEDEKSKTKSKRSLHPWRIWIKIVVGFEYNQWFARRWWINITKRMFINFRQ